MGLSFGLHLLLVRGQSAHFQLGDILLGGHAVLGGFRSQLLSLLLRKLLRRHATFGSLCGELLHRSHLLGGRPGCRHFLVRVEERGR